MNKIPMLALVAFVSGVPLAFAASSNTDTNTNLSRSNLSTLHCPALEQGFDDGQYRSQSAVKDEDLSLCRQDRHHERPDPDSGHNRSGARHIVFIR